MFDENPLSLSISESEFEAWLIASNTKPASAEERSHAKTQTLPSHTRPWTLWGMELPLASVRLPKLKLKLEDLAKPPLPWTLHFLDCGKGPWNTFSRPHSWDDAAARVETNYGCYAGNYLRLAAAIFLCVLYRHPLALLGLLAMLGLGLVMARLSLQIRASADPLLLQGLLWGVHLATWVVLFYCRILPALCMATMASFAAIFLHGALRDPLVRPQVRQPRWQFWRRKVGD